MPSNIVSYPFSENLGEEINHGFVSIVREFGSDWVIKEFNPLKSDGTPKDETHTKEAKTHSIFMIREKFTLSE